MEFFSGLDVGMDETAICVVDDKGKVVLQTTVVTDPDAIKLALKPYLGRLRWVGHEAGSWSPWLHPELEKLDLPAVCLEDAARARRAKGATQQDRQDRRAGAGASHAHRLDPLGPHQERGVLPAATVVDAPAQSEAQVRGSAECHPAFAEGLWHAL